MKTKYSGVLVFTALISLVGSACLTLESRALSRRVYHRYEILHTDCWDFDPQIKGSQDTAHRECLESAKQHKLACIGPETKTSPCLSGAVQP